MELRVRDTLRDSTTLKSVLAGKRSSIDEAELSSLLAGTVRSRSSCGTALGISRNTNMAKVGKSLASTIRTD